MLAGAVWWIKPAPFSEFSHFAEQDSGHPNIYWVKPRYMQDLLLLYELRDCEFAVIAFEGEWSMHQQPFFQALQQVSINYDGRVSFFLYRMPEADWLHSINSYPKQLPTFQAAMKSVGFVGLFQRGKLIATLSTLAGYLAPEEYRQKIDAWLPWNYKL